MPAAFPPPVRLPVAMLAIFLCTAVPCVIGQVIYKSTMPDGSVLYGDAPAPGAVKVESGQAPSSKGVAPVTDEQTSRIEAEQKQYFSDLQRARDEVSAAEAAVTQAQAERDAGKDPLPGERQSRRLTEAYFERQRAFGVDPVLRTRSPSRARLHAGSFHPFVLASPVNVRIKREREATFTRRSTGEALRVPRPAAVKARCFGRWPLQPC